MQRLVRFKCSWGEGKGAGGVGLCFRRFCEIGWIDMGLISWALTSFFSGDWASLSYLRLSRVGVEGLVLSQLGATFSYHFDG